MDWRKELDTLTVSTSDGFYLRVIALQLAELITLMRPLAIRDDYATAATSPDVCTCDYKPFPHPKFPAHPNTPKPLVSGAAPV